MFIVLVNSFSIKSLCSIFKKMFFFFRIMHFEDLSNELLLCIWNHLLEVDVIFSCSNINNRINSLLYKYCGLYTKLDLRYSSSSILINNYIPHHSLVNLNIRIVDFLTLNVLLHYLPQLQHIT